MKIISILFYKKLDYVVFAIGLTALIIILADLFYTLDMDSSMLWSQIAIVFLYYLVTRGRAEKNLMRAGIEPVIFLSFFGLLVLLFFFANVMIFLNFLGMGAI